MLVTATRLDVQVFGGMAVASTAVPYAPQCHMLYKGVLMEGLPNFAWILGYTSLSWTLKVGIAAGYLVPPVSAPRRQRPGRRSARATSTRNHTEESVMGNLTSGYEFARQRPHAAPGPQRGRGA